MSTLIRYTSSVTNNSGRTPAGDDTRSAADRWRSAAPDLLPLTSKSAQVAEALLLHLHYSINWDDGEWISDERWRYWDRILPGRVRTAAYRAESLDGFWSQLRERLPVVPIKEERRLEVANLLRHQDPDAVIDLLKTALPALLLRVQIISNAVGEARSSRTSTTTSTSRRRGRA